jgi:hypothetical protein
MIRRIAVAGLCNWFSPVYVRSVDTSFPTIPTFMFAFGQAEATPEVRGFRAAMQRIVPRRRVDYLTPRERSIGRSVTKINLVKEEDA